MSAKVNFLANPLQESDGSLQPFTGVPKAAIATRNGQSVVFVVKEGTLAETPVTTGREVAGYVEVTGGLSIGDQVVLNPTADARSGLKVKIAQ
jgi:hypothetical protein